MQYCLVTGGLGFIGSHTVITLLEKDHNVIILDNLSNSNPSVLTNICQISGKEPVFIKGDILDTNLLNDIFNKYNITFVIHFAALKAVANSVKSPLEYYNNNINGTINLLQVMDKYNCNKIIFSSSATVYGDQTYPVTENCRTGTGITNPYGKTKYMIEEILQDLYISNNKWSIIILRYFNPIGAHYSGLIGENPQDVPNNLFPYVLKVVNGTYPVLSIYGSDYDTVDGTASRDYIHVMDLATGHLASIAKLNEPKVHIYNLGTGHNTTVLQLINIFEGTTGHKVPYKIVGRREGDLPVVYADANKAMIELNWSCKYNLKDMCKDAYHFINMNSK
jgi:UDP-glucose 4-epimerase